MHYYILREIKYLPQ